MGRPSGKALNPQAFLDLFERLDPPMTRADVAEAVGVSPGYLSDLVKGKVFASDTKAHNLAAVLRCRRETLFPEYTQFGPRPRTKQEKRERKVAA